MATRVRQYDYDTPAVEKLFDYLVEELSEAEIVVFGHFHTPLVKQWGNQLLVNPGSVAPHKGHQSFGLVDLSSLEPNVEIVEL